MKLMGNMRAPKTKIAALVLTWLLGMILASAVISVGRTPFAAADSDLTLDLTTDKTSYQKGQTIHISGENVKDAENNPVVSGTATIRLSSGGWGQRLTTQITNGAFSADYIISYGNPDGTWTITATATDSAGNSGTTSKNVNVTTPENVVYLVQFSSPTGGSTKRRGENVTISAIVTLGVAVDNAVVSTNTPTGEKITLTRTAPGIYTNTYTLRWDDPAENWSISAEATKAAENRAGGSWINIPIQPATLTVNLQSPTKSKYEVGESVEVRVGISYPFGGPVENATISVSKPRGGALSFTHQGSGVYSATYPVTSADIGAWTIAATATDLDNNSGDSASKTITLTAATVPGFLEQYWWAILSAALAIGLASAYVGRGKILAGKLEDVRKEIKEIPKLKKEAAIKYFKDGSISRPAYDGLIKRYDARMDELKKKEAALRARIKKEGKKKR